MDEGKYILQCAIPRSPDLSADSMRHEIFVQQCKSLLQVVDWLSTERLSVVNGRAEVRGASYVIGGYSPNLESVDGISLNL